MKLGTPGFVPGRLTEARAARRIPSKSALARTIGHSPSTVSRWEDGTSSPDPETLLEVSQKLDVRPAFFLRPMMENDRPAFLRSLSSTLVRDREFQVSQVKWLQEISAAVGHYVDFPELDIPDVLSGTGFRQLRDEDIEGIAADLRKHWGLGDGPCLDVVGLMERIGIIVGSIEIGTSKLDGICSWSPIDGRPHVLLSEDKMSFARRQMDGGHELGHAVLHRDVTADDLKKDLKLIETQAFRFASAFLLPSTSYPLEVTEPSLHRLVSLKERWRVAVKAQIKRLSDLEMITPERATHLYKLYSAKRWNSSEPFDDVWGLQQPSALREAMMLIVDEQVRDKDEMLNLEFTISAGDIETLCNLPPGWFRREATSVVSLKQPGTIRQQQWEGVSEVIPFNRKR